jgi:DinB family protein
MNPNALTQAVEDVLLQGRALLTSVDDATYSRKRDGGSSMGAHYRHVLDHFICLAEGLRDGHVDYDRRERNPKLENSVEDARFVTESLLQEFRALDSATLNRGCTVAYAVGYREAEAQSVPSNVAREVMFCVGHAIHHYAIIKMVAEQMGVRLMPNFGIAPSTIKYLESQAAG